MKNFEKNLERLDEIIEQIDGQVSLSQSLELYKEGMALAAETAVVLQEFQSEVEILQRSDGEEDGF